MACINEREAQRAGAKKLSLKEPRWLLISITYTIKVMRWHIIIMMHKCIVSILGPSQFVLKGCVQHKWSIVFWSRVWKLVELPNVSEVISGTSWLPTFQRLQIDDPDHCIAHSNVLTGNYYRKWTEGFYIACASGLSVVFQLEFPEVSQTSFIQDLGPKGM